MQLSEHDLKQLDEETIRSLAAENLCTLSLKLLADLKEARDRLNQSPDNSSRPPSSRAPWERASSDAQDDGEQEDEESREADRQGEQGAGPNDPSTGAQDTKDSELEQTKNRWAKPAVSEIIRSQEPCAPTPNPWVAVGLGICSSANTT